jgi:hypothetical protein
MFVRRTCILIVVVFLGGIVYASEATGKLQESDSIGMMPEVVVTAPRYENQDEAWAGLVEGVVVEAQRFIIGSEATIVGVNGRNISTDINGGNSIHGGTVTGLLGIFTLILAMISIMYLSLRVLFIAQEVEHERTKH